MNRLGQLSGVALLIAAVAALASQAAIAAVNSPRDVYTDGARHAALSDRIDGVRTLAGLDRTGPSTPPARSADPYTDGALA